MVTVILRSRSFWIQMVRLFDFYPEAGGWISSECLSYLLIDIIILNEYIFYADRIIKRSQEKSLSQTTRIHDKIINLAATFGALSSKYSTANVTIVRNALYFVIYLIDLLFKT